MRDRAVAAQGDRSACARETRNVVESSLLRGTVVQAAEIHGGVHVRTDPSPRTPVPQQLLPVPADFVDRDTDLASLHRARTEHRGDSGLIVAVTGPAGVGKTALVSRWLTSIAMGYPDGQLYADLGGHSLNGRQLPSDVLGRFLRSLGCTQVPAELAEMAALWRSLTAGRQLAVMLDNALSAAQVRPLLPGGSGSLVAVVSRRKLTGLALNGAVFRALDVLGPKASMELFRRRVGDCRASQDPASVRLIATLCAGFPLAVCVAAARVAARPRHSVAAVAGAMTADAHRLDSLRVDGDAVVESALDDSYRTLTDEVARTYRRFGVLPVDVFGVDAAAAACAVSRTEMSRLLDELMEASLVEDAGEGPAAEPRYRLHDLIRLHALRRFDREEGARTSAEVVRGCLEWYLATATAARILLAPTHRRMRRDYSISPVRKRDFDSPEAALEWMNAEGPSLMRLVRLASERGWSDMCWQLVDAMQPWFLRSRPYDLWVESHRLGLAAARHAGHTQGVSRMLTTGGSGLYNAGHLDEALDWFTLARDDAGDRCDRRAEAQALHGLGQTHRLAGRLELAATFFTEALGIRLAIGYRRGAALSRLCLGDVALADDRPDEARLCLARARAELLVCQDRYDAARALAFLGRAHAHASLRQPDEAVRLLAAALDEFRAAGSVHWQARVLEMLGQTAQEYGDADAATRHFLESLHLYRPVSPRDTERLEERLRKLRIGRSDG